MCLLFNHQTLYSLISPYRSVWWSLGLTYLPCLKYGILEFNLENLLAKFITHTLPFTFWSPGSSVCVSLQYQVFIKLLIGKIRSLKWLLRCIFVVPPSVCHDVRFWKYHILDRTHLSATAFFLFPAHFENSKCSTIFSRAVFEKLKFSGRDTDGIIVNTTLSRSEG